MKRTLLRLLGPLCLLTAARAQFEFPANSPASHAEMISEAKAIAPGSTFSVALKLEHPGGLAQLLSEFRRRRTITGDRVDAPERLHRRADPMARARSEGRLFRQELRLYRQSGLARGSHRSDGSGSRETGDTHRPCHAGRFARTACINEEKTVHAQSPGGGRSWRRIPPSAALFVEARARSQPATAEWLVLLSRRPTVATSCCACDPDAAAGIAASRLHPGPAVRESRQRGRFDLPRRRFACWSACRAPPRTRSTTNSTGRSRFPAFSSAQQPVVVPDTMIATASAVREALSFAKFLPILGGMLLGGLILNLMPCVFPVIGLKIMGFVQQAGADRRKIVLHGLIFALGVLASFGVLSGILFAARAASGAGSIGWGYQLQNPWVVLCLMLLMFVLALNMFGVFEIGTSATSVGGSLQSKHGLAGSFFSGVLATVVATPCSAPFLGAAIGAAIALPAVQFFAAFGAMAVGLATALSRPVRFPEADRFPAAPRRVDGELQAGDVLPALRHRRLSALGLCRANRPRPPAGSGLRTQRHRRGRLDPRPLEPAAPQRPNPRHRPRPRRFSSPLGGIYLAKPPKPSALDVGTVVAGTSGRAAG